MVKWCIMSYKWWNQHGPRTFQLVWLSRQIPGSSFIRLVCHGVWSFWCSKRLAPYSWCSLGRRPCMLESAMLHRNEGASHVWQLNLFVQITVSMPGVGDWHLCGRAAVEQTTPTLYHDGTSSVWWLAVLVQITLPMPGAGDWHLCRLAAVEQTTSTLRHDGTSSVW